MEVLVVLGIFYMLYSLILPSTRVIIQPAYQVEDIVYKKLKIKINYILVAISLIALSILGLLLYN